MLTSDEQPWKAPRPIDVTESGTTASVIRDMPLKAFEPTLTRPLGNSKCPDVLDPNSATIGQFMNAPSPMLFMDELSANETSAKEMSLRKASWPMADTLEGMRIEASKISSMKAAWPIVTRPSESDTLTTDEQPLKASISMVSVPSPTLMLVALAQFWKALSQTFVTEEGTFKPVPFNEVRLVHVSKA